VGNLAAVFVNYPGAALTGKIPPDPLDADQHTLFEVDEEIDMDHRPQEPR
jgi:hypothetical protein